MKGKDLTVGKPFGLILEFALPIVLGNLFQQVYNLVDTLLVGRFLGVEALAGVGATGAINFLIVGFCCGLGSGFVIPIANRFGAKDYEDLRLYFGNSLSLSLVFAVVITTVVSLLTRNILVIMNTPSDIIEYSYNYILVIFLGIPVTLAYNVLAGAVRSIGDSKTPLYVLLIASGVNIVLDYVLIVPVKLGVTGAAIATISSQLMAVVMLIVIIRRKFDLLHLSRKHYHMEKSHIKRLLSMGIPMGLQYSITAIGGVILTSSINTLGAIAVASQTAANKISMLACTPLDSLGTTMATYAGQNLGAGKYDRINEGLRAGLIMGSIFSIAVLVFLLFFSDNLVGLFVTNPSEELISMSTQFLVTIAFFYIPLTGVNVFRFMLQGLNHATLAITAGFMEMIARMLAGIVLVPIYGFTGACFASPLAWIFADAFLIPAYIYVMKKIKKSLETEGDAQLG